MYKGVTRAIRAGGTPIKITFQGEGVGAMTFVCPYRGHAFQISCPWRGRGTRIKLSFGGGEGVKGSDFCLSAQNVLGVSPCLSSDYRVIVR